MSKQGDAFNKLYDQMERLEAENAELKALESRALRERDALFNKCAELEVRIAAKDDGLQKKNAELKAREAKLLDVLRDVWNQFATERPDGSKWAGGLSTLEDAWHALQAAPDAGAEREGE